MATTNAAAAPLAKSHRVEEPKPIPRLPNRQRVQVDFSPEAYGRLLKMREMSGVKTNAEVFRNALRLYDWFLEQKQADVRVQLLDPDGTIRLVELIF